MTNVDQSILARRVPLEELLTKAGMVSEPDVPWNDSHSTFTDGTEFGEFDDNTR